MLNVKTNSLLYKWLDFSSSSFTYKLRSGSVSLCNLFWTAAFYAVLQIVPLAVVIVFCTILGSLALPLFGMVLTASSVWWVYPTSFGIGALIITAIAALAIGIGALVYAGCTKLEEWKYNRRFERSLREEQVRDEEVNLRNLWVKTKLYKRDKLCPMIRVEYAE